LLQYDDETSDSKLKYVHDGSLVCKISPQEPHRTNSKNDVTIASYRMAKSCSDPDEEPMRISKRKNWCIALAALFTMAVGGAVVPQSAQGQIQPSAGMMRYPDVSADKIVFVYADDLWVVSRDGGLASPLASPEGEERFPRFSSDGSKIAFVGNYDGGTDIYTVPANGGSASRITYHPASETLCDWTPSGGLLYSSNGFAGLGRQPQLFTISEKEPYPQRLPVPYGTNGAISADGRWLAYTPYSRDTRTWKRYRGGMASDVWIFNLQTNEAKQITDFEGTDSLPMWMNQTVYYLSDDGPEHRLNIWSYDTSSGDRQQVTKFKDFDVKWPSMGPGADGNGEIVLQAGPSLYLLSLTDKKTRQVEITIPGDRPSIRPQQVDVAESIVAADISPSAKRIVVEARGDIWTLPAKNGSPRNLTATSGIAERSPSWSPDGKWIAYFSDATGEYELMVMQSDGRGETKQLTKGGKAFRFDPVWSPDSKHLTFTDKAGAVFLHSIEGGETKLVDTDPTASQLDIRWSHDSAWLTYSKAANDKSNVSSIWVYNVAGGKATQLTSGFFNDSSPTFDRKGDFIYFSSNRAFNRPSYDDASTSFIYAGTEVLVAMPLRADVEHPLLDKSDEEELKSDDDEKDEEAKDKDSDDKDADDKDDKKEEKAEPIKIDFENIERRCFRVPVDQGSFGSISVNDKGQLIYARLPATGARGGGGGDVAIKMFDFADDKRKEKEVVKGAAQFMLTPDGKKMGVMQRDSMYIVDAAAGQKLEAKISTDGMIAVINPQEEWRQMFIDAWRIERDYFYDPYMHGLNWDAIRVQYAQMLKDCISRRDLSFVIREMIAEINVGHAYYREGDVENGPSGNVGLLGCRFAPEGKAYKIDELFQGADWDLDARNPLVAAGVKRGQFILDVNGVALTTDQNPYSVFQGLAGKTVVLTVSDDAKMDADDKQIAIKTMGNDQNLRFRAWIENNRKMVDAKSGGKIGYIYVVNTGIPGQNDLVRQYFGQIAKEGLIIDDRWNGGGQIPTRFIELLNRPVTNYWAVRDGMDWTWPPDAHHGAKAMLINGMAGSGGDMFPALFKQNKLGKLIGMRTWGGLVGMSGNPGLIDGAGITAPTFAYYETDGTWGIEGHGVDPDIKVIDDPAKMVDGGDPQLDVAIKTVLSEIESRPYRKPDRPAYPNRSRFGIDPKDK